MTLAPSMNLPPEVLEHMRLAAGVRLGMPRGYIERYFKIASEGVTQEVVPMLFSHEPNQEYYLEQIFGEESASMGWPLVDVLCLKDRKARWTSFVAACLTAKMFAMPGTHILCVVNAEDTFAAVNKFIDGFWANMPIEVRPEKRGSEWGTERKVVTWVTRDGQGKLLSEITSTFTIRTAANANVGTGETHTDVWFDEYGKFAQTFSQDAQASIRASMPASCSFWRGGTVGPDGPVGAMYEEIQSIKRGERQTLYLFRTCLQNPANRLQEGSRLRRPQDRRNEDIVAGVDGGPNCEKEPLLVSQYPEEYGPVEDFLAWRRAKMVDALLAAGGPGNEDAAAILYAKEHCEDDESPWLLVGRSQFRTDLLEQYNAIARDRANIAVIHKPLEGLQCNCWRDYDPTHTYLGGMDLGGGGGG